ncbi:PAS domain S-box protein [Leptolyngbya sp. NIES-2104]|uniref:PAS domain S-box protein n=1 Tax=Leptolyngbya sp. NIES-2104 TaxID=1552121 RepID=UPI0006EC564E|nr:PAS domain S-box protein [Leptolyngbya sp. NIES-2104]GAP98930.1 two-component hybrid sensor and regulator [Leptolyngbya sp. NIES-2104]
MTQQVEARSLATSSVLQVGTLLQLADGRVQACDAGVEQLLGYTATQLIGTTPTDPPWQTIDAAGKTFPPEDYPSSVALKTGQPHQAIMGFYQPTGDLIWLQVEAIPLFQFETPYAVVVTLRPATTQRPERSQLMLIEQNRLLELIASGRSLDECLSAVCDAIARLNPGIRACFLLTDAERKSFPRSITPSLPPSFGAGLKDAPINDLCIGTCGEAVYRGQPIACTDVQHDERWSEEWRQLCIAHGILACHSEPVMGIDQLPLGSLMLCFDQARMPSDWEHQVAAFGAQVASIVFERDRVFAKNQQTQEKLQRTNHTLSTLIDASPLPIVVIEPDNCVKLWNPAAEKVFGWTAAEVLGQPIPIVPPDRLEECQKIRAAVVRGETFFGVETYRSKQDSAIVNVSVSAAPLYDNQGTVQDIMVIYQDVTDRQRAEAAIRQSEARYRALTELSPQIVYVSNPNGLIEYCNQWGLDFTGRSLEQLQGYGWADLIHPNYRDRTYTAWMDSLQNHNKYELEVPYLRADGEYRWLYTCASPVRNESGAIDYWIGIALDVHDRKEAELAVCRQEAEFRLLAESLPQIVWVTDADGKTSYVNQQWIEFSGLTLEENATPGIQQSVIHPDDRARVYEEWTIAFQQRSTYRVEARMRNHQTGDYHWFLIRAEPFKDEAGNILRWFGTSTDITETKRREQHTVFLAEISQELTIERSESEMMQVLSEKIGQFFAVSNCAFAKFDSSIDVAVIYHDWRRDQAAASLVGEYPVEEFAALELWERMIDSHPVVIDDVVSDPRTAPFAEQYQAINVRAFLNAPFVSDDGIQFAIVLHHDQPYQWRTDEIELLQQLTTRIWAYLERDRAVQKLRAVEARLQDTLASIREDFVMFDFDWNVSYLNAQAALSLRQPYEKIIGRNFWELFPDLVETEFWHQVQRAMRDRVAVQFQYYYPTWNCWFENRIYPTAEGVVNLCTDITERKQIEEALEQRTAILELINQATPILVFMKDRQGRYVYANPAALDVLGKSAVEVIGHSDQELFSADIDPIMETDQRILTSGKMEAIEETVGVRTFLSIKAPQRNEVGDIIGLIGVSTDISDRVELERDREQVLQREQAAREAAEQANRMKDEFLAVLSHELRSPLNPILGWTKILRTGNLSPERSAHALETIERNAQLQSELVEDLLDVARILQGKLSLTARSVNVVMMIRSAIETVRLAAESKQIALDVQLSEVGEVSGDATRLQQIVWNLLSNAVKFTPQGGRVTVRLESVNNQAQITITDTGKGISPNFLPHVFEYFRQEDGATTRKFGGLGLGLAIVRHLVELHGGTVSATSDGEGLGATFTVMLPLINVQSRISESIDQTDPNDLNGLQLLIVDDEQDSREFIAFVLEQAGAQVTMAGSGSEAFSQLMRSRFDVLVSDIGMPNMDGYMLIQQIRNQGRTVNAIALTAYAGDFNQQRALQAGFQAHLAKPIDPDRLIQEVAKFRDRL